MPDCNAPIGIFDSGLGGLTAVKQLRKLLPGEDIIYFGDTGRVPYGTRGKDTIIQYAKQDIEFLLSKNVKLIMAACGTVSSVLQEGYTNLLPIPYMGVLQSAAQAAVNATKTKRIGLIGTSATVRSGSYNDAIHELMPKASIIATSCPLFVPLVENGYFDKNNKVTRLVAADYLKDMLSADIDTLILGCTHYPLIAPIIADIMGEGVTLIDPGKQTSLAAVNKLEQLGLLRQNSGENKGQTTYFVSDDTHSFAQLSTWFLGENVGGNVTRINVDNI